MLVYEEDCSELDLFVGQFYIQSENIGIYHSRHI